MKKDYIYISVIICIVFLAFLLLLAKNNNTSVTQEVTISEALVYLKPGKEYNLTFMDNSKGSKNFVFESSNPSIATVDSKTGKIEAVSNGTVTISAKDALNNTIYDSCEVVVEGQKAQTKTKETKVKETTNNEKEQLVKVTFNKNEITLDKGKSLDIVATISPNNASDKTLIWSSDDESVAKVSNGTITGVNSGTATITATTSTGNTATCKVTVIEKTVNVSSIKIMTDKKAVYTGSTLGLSVTINPSNALDKTITWTSSDDSIATVKDGIVTGIKAGTVVITARSNNGKESTIKISVLDSGNEVSSLRINYSGTTLKVGDSITLVATILPNYVQARSIIWTSSDESVVYVSNSGEITAKKSGIAIITATTDTGKSATSKITVVNNGIEVTDIKLSKTQIEVNAGEKVVLDAIISPRNATRQKLNWTSSDESIATVSLGNVTTLKPGIVVITATSENGKSASCTITIKERKETVTKISLSKTFTTLYIGQTEKIDVILTPSTASDKSVTWYSENPQIVTVSNDGTLKAISVGTTEVSAKSSNGKVATMKVRVESGVTKITLNKTNTSLVIGNSEQLIATITPSDAPNKTIIWSTSDNSIVSVTNGIIIAKKEGTATITAKSIDGKKATCTVVVNKPIIPVTDISINVSNVSMKIGETVTLNASVSPSNATDKTITWSTSDSNIVSVDNGTIIAIKEGEATITVTSSNGKTATCKVVVNDPNVPVTSIKINVSNISIMIDESITLNTTILPSNATDKTVTWSSSDDSIATVKDGVITGIKAGTVTITATSSNGKTATCKVTVKTNSYYKLDKTYITCEEGNSAIITVTASSRTKKITTANSKIVTVNYKELNKYTVNCNAPGFTLVKFEGSDGASAILRVNVRKKTSTYNIAKDYKFDKYEQIASCYSDTLSYRIIKIDGNYYSLVWVSNANKQINNGLAYPNAQGILPVEEIFNSKIEDNKCFIGINGSFTTNESPRTNVVISEGNVAKNKGNSTNTIGIDSNGNIKFFDNYSVDDILRTGVRNTFRVSGRISEDTTTDIALRTQLYQYDKNNFILYSGKGTISSGLENINSLTGITEGYNLEGGAGRKLYYKTKTSSLIKVVGGDKKIPDALYISE